MSIDFALWTNEPGTAPRQLRERRSGLSGFGGRPALHPAWRAPSDPDAACSDGRDAAPPASGVRR